MATEKKNLPLVKYRAGSISASVFSNKFKGTNGKPDFTMESISIQRSYKEKDSDEWKNQQISIRKNDLAKLQVVINKLLEHQFLNKDDKESEE